jgi:hypothetical protein
VVFAITFQDLGHLFILQQQTPWDEYTLGNLAVARGGITGLEISKKKQWCWMIPSDSVERGNGAVR